MHRFHCRGADVSAVNEDGKTAAQVAELNEHAEVAGLFTKISREG